MRPPVRVLVVDDDVDFRAMLSWQLRRVRTCAVVGNAADRIEALQAVGQLHPQVAVVDPRMTDGLRLIDRLVNDHPEVVTVAYADEDRLFVADQLHAMGVETLPKSADAERLVKAITRLTPPERPLAVAP